MSDDKETVLVLKLHQGGLYDAKKTDITEREADILTGKYAPSDYPNGNPTLEEAEESAGLRLWGSDRGEGYIVLRGKDIQTIHRALSEA